MSTVKRRIGSSISLLHQAHSWSGFAKGSHNRICSKASNCQCSLTMLCLSKALPCVFVLPLPIPQGPHSGECHANQSMACLLPLEVMPLGKEQTLKGEAQRLQGGLAHSQPEAEHELSLVSEARMHLRQALSDCQSHAKTAKLDAKYLTNNDIS